MILQNETCFWKDVFFFFNLEKRTQQVTWVKHVTRESFFFVGADLFGDRRKSRRNWTMRRVPCTKMWMSVHGLNSGTFRGWFEIFWNGQPLKDLRKNTVPFFVKSVKLTFFTPEMILKKKLGFLVVLVMLLQVDEFGIAHDLVEAVLVDGVKEEIQTRRGPAKWWLKSEFGVFPSIS